MICSFHWREFEETLRHLKEVDESKAADQETGNQCEKEVLMLLHGVTFFGLAQDLDPTCSNTRRACESPVECSHCSSQPSRTSPWDLCGISWEAVLLLRRPVLSCCYYEIGW